jgi:hypothetical protein
MLRKQIVWMKGKGWMELTHVLALWWLMFSHRASCEKRYGLFKKKEGKLSVRESNSDNPDVLPQTYCTVDRITIDFTFNNCKFYLYCTIKLCIFTVPHLHFVVCLTTGPQPLPKRVLHRVRSSASYFSFQYLLVPLRSSSRCLHLLPRLPVTYILPSI